MSSATGPHPASGVRRANLSRVLTLLHERGALSRAALTAATGLNRSTTGGLVESLVGAGLVAETAAESAGRSGRPSPLVAVDSEVTAVAVNPEVDAVTIALVGLDRVVRRRVRVPHRSPSPEQTAALVVDHLRAWAPRWAPVGVGLAVPGLVDADTGVVRDASHLGWRDAPLARLVAGVTGLPAVVANDATVGLAAEHRFGAARDMADVVYLNGGASGIGGAVVAHGRLLTGARGYAGEFGRTAIDLADPRRVLEDEVNRGRLLDALREADLDDAALAEALHASTDPSVAAEVARQRRLLAAAIAQSVAVLNPSAVVLGGFLAALAAADVDDLTAAVRASVALPEPAEDVVIRVASLGDDRLLIGAAEAAFVPLLADPLG